jgi:hypothetical protein
MLTLHVGNLEPAMDAKRIEQCGQTSIGPLPFGRCESLGKEAMLEACSKDREGVPRQMRAVFARDGVEVPKGLALDADLHVIFEVTAPRGARRCCQVAQIPLDLHPDHSHAFDKKRLPERLGTRKRRAKVSSRSRGHERLIRMHASGEHHVRRPEPVPTRDLPDVEVANPTLQGEMDLMVDDIVHDGFRP